MTGQTLTFSFFQSKLDLTLNAELFTLGNLAKSFKLGLDVFDFLVETRTNFSCVTLSFSNKCCFAALSSLLEGLALKDESLCFDGQLRNFALNLEALVFDLGFGLVDQVGCCVASGASDLLGSCASRLTNNLGICVGICNELVCLLFSNTQSLLKCRTKVSEGGLSV